MNEISSEEKGHDQRDNTHISGNEVLMTVVRTKSDKKGTSGDKTIS